MAQPTPLTPGQPQSTAPPAAGLSPTLAAVLVLAALAGGFFAGRNAIPPTPTPSPGPPPAVVISGPATATVGEQVVLAVKGPVAGRLKWKAAGVNGKLFVPDASPLQVAFTPASAGVANFTAESLSIVGAEIVETDGTFSLTVVGPTPPPPPPGPTPTPTPPVPPAPAPAKAPLHVSAIFEDTAKTPAVASVLDSPTIGAAVAAVGGSVYRNFPKGDPTSTAAGLDSVATAFGLPCVVVQDASGAVVGTFKLPGTEAEFLASVRSVAAGGRP